MLFIRHGSTAICLRENAQNCPPDTRAFALAPRRSHASVPRFKSTPASNHATTTL